tara:strand:- start:36 stop:371 length:336 start_codon:yes stop_codon:yes gene_type:complete
MRITKEMALDLAEKELQSKIKSHWSKRRIWTERYALRQQVLGLCRYCPNPVSSEKSMMCDYHLEIKRKENKKYKKEKRCHACGIKLRAEVEEAYRCHACKEKHANLQRGYN